MSSHRPLVLASMVIAAVVAAGIAFDRVSPASPRPRPVAAPRASGGVWACPVVSFGARGGRVNLANASLDESTVRIEIIRAQGKPSVSTITLGPGAARSMVTKGEAAGAIVQWAGGDVVASRSAAVDTPGKHLAATGAACSRTGDRVLVVPGLSTFARDAHVVLLNPSSADALVDVSFLYDGDEQAPETLHRRVVPARSRLDVRVGDFIFDKYNIAAVVRIETGTVVADGVQLSTAAAYVVPATAPRRSGTAVATSRFGAFVNIVAVGDDAATVAATTASPQGQQTAMGFPGTLDPLTSRNVAVPLLGPQGISVGVRDGSPVSATLGWSAFPKGGGDVAAVPFTTPAKRWIAVTQSPLPDWSAQMVLSNPGPSPVRLRARLLTASGQIASGDLADISLLGGRVFTYPFPVTNAVIGVEVLSLDGPVGFTMVVRSGSRGATAIFALNGAAPQRSNASVELDPRAGIPARIEER